jgi:hypothetical protein
MTKRFWCTVLAASTLSLTMTVAADAANQLYPNTAASRPASGVTGVAVEQGKKAILLTMQCLDANGVPQTDCWPLANGNPSLSINGGLPINCANTLSPPLNGCGYTIGAFTPADPNVDTFKIYYNGIFPAGASIAVSVASATGNAGSSEINCPNPSDPGCTLSFTAGANTPRTAVNTELVFHISGSMSQPSVPGAMVSSACPANPVATQAVQRICALKQAAHVFLAAYEPMTMLNDQLGLIVFSTAASVPGGGAALVNAIDPIQIAGIKSQIDMQAPTNSTAIGQGLKLAGMNFSGTNAKWVILFTDGEQNVAPNVDPPGGSQLTIGGMPYSTSTNGLPNPGQIGVCPITAGPETAVGYSLLQGVAGVLCNNQNSYIEGTDQDFFQTNLNTHFAQLLTMILQGDKFEISRDLRGNVQTAPIVTFLGNAADRSLEIILTARGERAGYRLIAPDGTDVPLQPRRFAGGSVAKLDRPVVVNKKRLPMRGKWQIAFDRQSFGDDPDYHVIVINDNATISTTFTTLGADIGTGDPLQVQATILERGKPLADATVTVDITGPSAGLGNVLSSSHPRGEPPNLEGDDPGGPGKRKLLTLYNDPESAKLFATKPSSCAIASRDQPRPTIPIAARPRKSALLLRSAACTPAGPGIPRSRAIISSPFTRPERPARMGHSSAPGGWRGSSVPSPSAPTLPWLSKRSDPCRTAASRRPCASRRTTGSAISSDPATTARWSSATARTLFLSPRTISTAATSSASTPPQTIPSSYCERWERM